MRLFSNIKKKISETVKKVKEIFVKTKPEIKEPEIKKPEPKPEPKIPYTEPMIEGFQLNNEVVNNEVVKEPEPELKPEPKIPYTESMIEIVKIERGKTEKAKKEPPPITTEERIILLHDFLIDYDLNNLSNQDKNQIIRFAYDIGYRYYTTKDWYEELLENKDLTDEQFQQILAQYRADNEKVDFSDASHFEDINQYF